MSGIQKNVKQQMIRPLGRRPAILYISYDGVLEPLGSGQVINYIERLATSYDIFLISYEKRHELADARATYSMMCRLSTAGIRWCPLRYHKQPSTLSTCYDIVAGLVSSVRICRANQINVIHARSYVAASIASAVKKLLGTRVLFDMRGLWVDERADGGLWRKNGLLFRVAKLYEAHLLADADHIVTLTHASVPEISNRARAPTSKRISVIPTCVDIARFSHCSYLSSGGLTIGYTGSVGTWYDFDLALQFFREILEVRSDARLLVLNRQQHPEISQALYYAGIPRSAVEVRSVEFARVPEEISRMDCGIAFYKEGRSRAAACPTKFGEYLASGVPCVVTPGVGDTAAILKEHNVGVVLGGRSSSFLKAASLELLTLIKDVSLRARCVETARRSLSLESGLHQYQRIYECLSGASSEENLVGNA